jgi:uncharacterized protein
VERHDHLSYRTALVTGASSGIGSSIARALAEAGATDLVLVARRSRELGELAADLLREHGTRSEIIVADLATRDGVAEVEDRIRSLDAPPVELLANCAGAATSGLFVKSAADDHQRVVDLNITAPIRLTAAALPRMLDASRGAVVTISSLSCWIPSPNNAVYAATKAFLTSWGESLHEEVRGSGVRVTTLAPGPVATQFLDVNAFEVGLVPKFGWLDAEDVARDALRAVAADRSVFVPGFTSRVTAAVALRVPRSLVRVVGRHVFREVGH